jgi:uncharacterized protein (TIGR02147 family)
MRDVFEFDDYKIYLNGYLDDPKTGGRGARAKLSEFIQCKTSYTAQVLRGSAHFSLEQGEAINEHFNHTEEEGHFFLLLIQLQRAGIKKLRDRFLKQIEEIRKNRLVLKNRLHAKPVIEEHSAMTFYSSWYFSAVHALVSIPGFQTPEVISQRLKISAKSAAEALKFLAEVGLLTRDPERGYGIGNARIHLGSDSPLISKHHINWRLQAIKSLEQAKPDNLHFSSVLSVSHEDALRIREMFVKILQTIDPIIRDSKEERLQSIGLDFFEL